MVDESGARRLTLPELAAEAAAPLELVERLVELGQIVPAADGTFDPRDGLVITTIQALVDSGIGLDDLAWLIEHGGAGFAVLGRLFAPPPPRSGPTYRELRSELGALGDRLPAIYAALGIGEPKADRPLRADEESILRAFVRLWHGVDPGGDADLRVARLAGESSRRMMEGWLDVWDATARPVLASQGAPRDMASGPADPGSNPTFAAAAMLRQFVSWIHERQLERTLNERIIASVENGLVAEGRLERRPEFPPAVAFVDLTGFSIVTEEQGDEAAAVIAGRLQDLADACARAHGGRIVKLLGDGVMLRFRDAATAVGAVLDLVEQIRAAGLPPAHAGVAAGRLVIRDGDVYGATVNLAARVAGRASAGQVLVEEGAVIALSRSIAILHPIGRVELKGVARPVALWAATPPGRDAAGPR